MPPVVGAKDPPSSEARARVIQPIDAPYVAGVVAEHVKTGATVHTDEAATYNVHKPWLDHDSVNHRAGDYVKSETGAGTQGMESFWSMPKRGYRSTYHKMSSKHLDRHVSEFSGNHNIRERDTAVQMAQLIAANVGKRLMYRDLVTGNGLDSGAGHQARHGTDPAYTALHPQPEGRRKDGGYGRSRF